MDSTDLAVHLGDKLRRAARDAGMSPTEFLDGGVSGTSTDGTVTVWVDGIGRITRVRIAPGSVRERDEERLAKAVAEASEAAVAAVTDLFALEPSAPPRPARPARPAEDDDMVPVIYD